MHFCQPFGLVVVLWRDGEGVEEHQDDDEPIKRHGFHGRPALPAAEAVPPSPLPTDRESVWNILSVSLENLKGNVTIYATCKRIICWNQGILSNANTSGSEPIRSRRLDFRSTWNSVELLVPSGKETYGWKQQGSEWFKYVTRIDHARWEEEHSCHAAPQHSTNLHFDLVIFWLVEIEDRTFLK